MGQLTCSPNGFDDQFSTDLQVGLDYISDIIGDKILKERKTDYIQAYVSSYDVGYSNNNNNKNFSKVASFREITEDPLLGNDLLESKLAATAKILPLKGPPNYNDLKILNKLRASPSTLDEKKDYDVPNGRLWISILKSVDDIVRFTKRKKFKERNIVLLTNAADEMDFDMFNSSDARINSVIKSLRELIESNDITLTVIGIGFENADVRDIDNNVQGQDGKVSRGRLVQSWQKFLTADLTKGKLINSTEILNPRADPHVKPVQPVKVFAGPFRFGFGALDILKDSHFADTDLSKTDHNSNSNFAKKEEDNDDAVAEAEALLEKDNQLNTLSFEVEGFPAIKSVSGPSRSTFLRTILDKTTKENKDDGDDDEEEGEQDKQEEAYNDNSNNLDRYAIRRVIDYLIYRKRSSEDIEKIKAEKKRKRQEENEKRKQENLDNKKDEDDVDENINNNEEREEGVEDNDLDDDDYDIDLYEPVSVNEKDLEKAYRYTNEVIPLSKELENERVYKTSPGLDFRGIMKLSKLPPWYLLSDTVTFIVAKIGSDIKNQVGFASMVESLIQLESVMVARFVKKKNTEVQMVALIPVTVDDGDESLEISPKKRNRNDDAIADASANTATTAKKKYAFAMARLPFAEDEKVTYFTKLDSLVTKTGQVVTKHDKLLPNDEMKDTMKQYILSMDMDDGSNDTNINGGGDAKKKDDFLYQTEFRTPLISDNGTLSFDFTGEDTNVAKSSAVDQKLLQWSPAVHKITTILKHVAINAAKENCSLNDYVKQYDPKSDISSLLKENDNNKNSNNNNSSDQNNHNHSKDKAKAKFLPSEYALLRHLISNSHPDPKLLRTAEPHLTKLIELLEVRYVSDDEKAGGRKKRTAGDEESGDDDEEVEFLGDFDENQDVPNLDELLGLS